jgi:hypothetical protein
MMASWQSFMFRDSVLIENKERKNCLKSRYSTTCQFYRFQAEWQTFNFRRRLGFTSSTPLHPEQAWGPLNLMLASILPDCKMTGTQNRSFILASYTIRNIIYTYPPLPAIVRPVLDFLCDNYVATEFVPLQCCQDDSVNENNMGGTCSTHRMGEARIAYNLVRISQRYP